jgi:AraC family transcriptional regulator, regulatory protein of adaptative response / methylated-DNA-[protein]-cysteine methyltransferase
VAESATIHAPRDEPDLLRVAAALEHLAEAVGRQPTVAEVARELHVSDAHLRRLFGRWAGISPKRYLEHLTALDGRALLREDVPTLDAAHAVGLSGTGRLHDLFVTLEAMTPGEVGSHGAGVTVRVGVHPTPFGPATIGVTDRGICAVYFADAAHDEVAADWPAAEVVRDQEATREAAGRIAAALTDSLGREPVRLVVRGTNLQVQVWRALLAIPPGETISYGRLAAEVGRPRAVRAVASAVGRNPVSYLIPCHRVLRASGALGGYRWGLDRKRAMLAVERARLGA